LSNLNVSNLNISSPNMDDPGPEPRTDPSTGLLRGYTARLAHPASISIGILLLLLLAILHGCPKTPFEQAQARAEAGNPHWLQIDLDTSDQRHKYKESDFIGFTVKYSSAVGQLYKAEAGEDYSTVAATDRLHISDGRTMPLRVYGIVCCDSRLIGLNDEPYIYHPQLRLLLKPGTYQMYVTTHRIFPWDVTASVYEPSQWETASNLLTLKVVPDPGWQERALAAINAKPRDPSMCDALSILDIPAATAQKLEIMRTGVPCQWRYSFNEAEYPNALKGMERLIQSPTYGVAQRDVNFVAGLRNWLAHPEARHEPEDREAFERWRNAQQPIFLATEQEVVREICSALPAKTPDAKLTTQHTIDGLAANKQLMIPSCR
jgi:hypothetical protein